MYTLILSCEHQAGQNRKPYIGDWIECPTCHKLSQIVDAQVHRRIEVDARIVAADFNKLAAASGQHYR